MDQEFVSNVESGIQTLIDSMVAKSLEFHKEFERIPGAPQIESGVIMPGVIKDPEAKQQIRAFIGDLVRNEFGRWKGMPNPAPMKEAAISTKAAIQGLSNTGFTTDDIPDLNDPEPADKELVIDLDGDIPSCGHQIETSIGGWRGEMVNSFRNNYTKNFREIFLIQTLYGSVLNAAILSEYELWDQGRARLLELLHDGAEAFDALDCMGGPERKLAVVYGVGILGITGALFPAVGALAALGAAALTATDAIADANQQKEVPLGGGTVDEVWKNIQEAAATLHSQILQIEGALGATLASVFDATSDKVSFNLDPKGDPIVAPVIDLLQPPAPAFVEAVKDAYATSTTADETALKETILDVVEVPNDQYAPPPFDD